MPSSRNGGQKNEGWKQERGIAVWRDGERRSVSHADAARAICVKGIDAGTVKVSLIVFDKTLTDIAARLGLESHAGLFLGHQHAADIECVVHTDMPSDRAKNGSPSSKRALEL